MCIRDSFCLPGDMGVFPRQNNVLTRSSYYYRCPSIQLNMIKDVFSLIVKINCKNYLQRKNNKFGGLVYIMETYFVWADNFPTVQSFHANPSVRALAGPN